MKSIVCPKCGGLSVYHYTDAYVLRTPVLNQDGTLVLVNFDTNEYDDQFFECFDCGSRLTESELISTSV